MCLVLPRPSAILWLLNDVCSEQKLLFISHYFWLFVNYFTKNFWHFLDQTKKVVYLGNINSPLLTKSLNLWILTQSMLILIADFCAFESSNKLLQYSQIKISSITLGLGRSWKVEFTSNCDHLVALNAGFFKREPLVGLEINKKCS